MPKTKKSREARALQKKLGTSYTKALTLVTQRKEATMLTKDRLEDAETWIAAVMSTCKVEKGFEPPEDVIQTIRTYKGLMDLITKLEATAKDQTAGGAQYVAGAIAKQLRALM